MLTPDDFPPNEILDVHDKAGARIASIRELTPLFRRQPSRDWGWCYRFECKRSPAIEWHDGGFATCKVGEQSPAINALHEAVAAADALFIQHLRSLPPQEAAKIVQTEISNENAVGDAGPFMLPTY